jgi:hypothetical protein
MQLLMFTHPDGGSAQVVVVWPSTGDAKAVKEISTLPSFIMAVSLQEFLPAEDRHLPYIQGLSVCLGTLQKLPEFPLHFRM